MGADADRLERVLSALPAEDAAWIVAQLAPPPPRRDRLDARDDAIRAAAVTLDGCPYRRAADLERTLRRYIAAGWSEDRRAGGPATEAPALRQHLFAIVTSNNGRGLGWRQLLRAIEGERTPPLLS
jgi:hypothetical protein